MKSFALYACLFLGLSSIVHAATYTNIDFPRAGLTSANGINNSGVIVGEYLTSAIHGFIFNAGVYTTVDFPVTGASTWCEGINDNGDIVGFYEGASSLDIHGFLLKDGVFTALDFPGSIMTQAYGINNAGQIVGSYSTGVGVQGFTYQDGVYTDVTVPNATYTDLRGIDSFGDMVGYYTRSLSHGLLVSGGVDRSVDVPGAIESFASSVNDLKAVAGYYDVTGNTLGFVRFRGTLVTITVPGGVEVHVLGINNNMLTVGYYNDSQNLTHGFLRTP